MDADIAGATNPLEVSKIRAQAHRDTLETAQAATARLLEEADKLDDAETLDFKRRVILVLAGNYMTTNANMTSPTTIAEDAAKDAARLEAAYKAVIAIKL